MELKITDLIDAQEIEKVKELAAMIESCKNKYADAAKELAKGLRIDVECKGDLDKLNTIVAASAKKAAEGSNELNEALKKQHELSEQLAQSLDKMAKSGTMSAKEAKTLADASKKNAEALEKEAKAEATLEKARTAGNKSRKDVVLTEEERKKKIQEALVLADKEVHSIAEANAANKELRNAVKLVKDTDEDYLKTLGKLNSTIGVNTDFVKRNSDRYTQQKMTIGDYKEQIKQAWMEINRGNVSMKNMGIVASNTGKMLNTRFRMGVEKAAMSVGDLTKGIIGANLLMGALKNVYNKLKDGVRVAQEFEKANSQLAAILGTTADKTKELQIQARQLGATTKYTAAEATNLQIELAKLGFTTQEVQNSTKYVLRFAQATGAELAEAAALAGASLRMFNADTTETERYVSAMAVSTSRSALSFSYLATAMPIVGPVAKSFNFTIEDTLALLGKLADSGFDASMAATATRNIFLNLADSGGKLATALGKPVTNLPELVEGLQKLRDEGVDLNTTLELTDKRSVAAFNAFLTAADGISILRKQVTGVEDELSAMAETMSNNTSGAIKTMESAWEELMITIYGNTGTIRTIVETTTEFIKDLTLWMQSAQTEAEKIAGKGSTIGASEEDYQKDIDAIERKKKAKIQAGKDETEADKEAREEQLDTLMRVLEKERLILKKSKKEFENVKWNSENGETEYIRNSANSIMNEVANELSSAQAAVNILENRIKRLQDSGRATTTTSGGGGDTDANLEKERQAAEKAAKERQKIEQQLQDANNELMEEGLDKEIAIISTKYNRKIAEIKGQSENEKALRIALGELMQQEIADATQKHADAELKQMQDEASKRVNAIAEETAEQQAIRTRQFELEQLALEKRKALKEISEDEYEQQSYALSMQYAKETHDAIIASLEEQLAVENLTAEERKRIAKELAEKKIAYAKAVTQAEIDAIEKTEKKDKDSSEKRKMTSQDWLQAASDAVGEFSNLMNTVFDGQMSRLESESEANQEACDREIERIEHLEETGAITKEEAEARKRAAEDRTAQKEAEIEKKRQQIAYKQAIWNKATQLAQVGISTALGIMQSIAQLGMPAAIPMVALVGAMGAMQAATIIATPIPKYAKGTDDHPGGLAVVGDGGKSEAVMTKDGLWLTPSVPTLIELPKHAVVFPDADKLPTDLLPEFMSPLPKLADGYGSPGMTIINDYSKLEKKVDATNAILAQGFNSMNKGNSYMNLQMYMNSRL